MDPADEQEERKFDPREVKYNLVNRLGDLYHKANEPDFLVKNKLKASDEDLARVKVSQFDCRFWKTAGAHILTLRSYMDDQASKKRALDEERERWRIKEEERKAALVAKKAEDARIKKAEADAKKAEAQRKKEEAAAKRAEE